MGSKAYFEIGGAFRFSTRVISEFGEPPRSDQGHFRHAIMAQPAGENRDP
jgi:hypothetical protein